MCIKILNSLNILPNNRRSSGKLATRGCAVNSSSVGNIRLWCNCQHFLIYSTQQIIIQATDQNLLNGEVRLEIEGLECYRRREPQTAIIIATPAIFKGDLRSWQHSLWYSLPPSYQFEVFADHVRNITDNSDTTVVKPVAAEAALGRGVCCEKRR